MIKIFKDLTSGACFKTKTFYLILCLFLLVPFIPNASATTVLPSTLEYMTDFSDSIIVGSVISKEGYWENKKIYTRIIVEVDEYVKHRFPTKEKQLELEILGGKVGEVAFQVDGAPHFEVGERVMLFLIKKKEKNSFQLYGFNYGAYRINYSPTLNKEIIRGPYFEYDEHVDPKTKKKVKGPEYKRVDGGRGEEFNLFKDKVKGLVK